MNTHSSTPRLRFHRHDRISIGRASYRVIGKERRFHILQLVADGVVDEHFIRKSDAELNELARKGRLKCEPGYFSKALTLIRGRNDVSDLFDLSEDDLRTILWKAEWCIQFAIRRADASAGTWRPTLSQEDLAIFVEEEKARLHRWYIDRFQQRRPLGRRIEGRPQKEFDYPSPSTLRNWLLAYSKSGDRLEAFRTRYDQCGRRDQMAPEVSAVVDECVKKYASSLRPKMRDIYEDVEAQLHKLNCANLTRPTKLYVSSTAVRRRIHRLDPLTRDHKRLGFDRAFRKYTPIGKGLVTELALERVEIDDWEVDLMALLETSRGWKSLSPKERQAVPRIRCTVTAVIDVATRAIVGLSVSPSSPSTASSRTALLRVMLDKDELAKAAGAKSSWPMMGRPLNVVSDGGSAFLGEFDKTIGASGICRLLPEKDPRKRGTIESFFRTLKRVCRYFAGQTFSNVVEKGDYNSEAMASLTFEQLETAIVRYVVDIYHHQAHKGLAGRTPFAVWKEAAGKGVYPPPDREQLALAFGIRVKRKLSKQGVRFLDLHYNSEELNLLFQRFGVIELDVIIYEPDIGQVTVVHTQDVGPNVTRRLNVPCVVEDFFGTPLYRYLRQRIRTRDLARDEVLAGLAIRLEAHPALTSQGERARRDANLEPFTITAVELDRLDRTVFRNKQAALEGPAQGTVEAPDIPPGTVAARSQRRSPKRQTAEEPMQTERPSAPSRTPASPIAKRPFGGSVNLDDEDMQ